MRNSGTPATGQRQARRNRRHVVATADEIAPGERKIVTVAGRSIGIFNVGGEFFALRNRCPHQGGALCRGQLWGVLRSEAPGEFQYDPSREILACPWHGWEFHIRTGQSWCTPERLRVRRYQVAQVSADQLAEGELAQGELGERGPAAPERPAGEPPGGKRQAARCGATGCRAGRCRAGRCRAPRCRASGFRAPSRPWSGSTGAGAGNGQGPVRRRDLPGSAARRLPGRRDAGPLNIFCTRSIGSRVRLSVLCVMTHGWTCCGSRRRPLPDGESGMPCPLTQLPHTGRAN